MRRKRGFVAQLRPQRLIDKWVGGTPSQVAAKLPQYSSVRGNTHGLAIGLTAKPSHYRLVEAPFSMPRHIFLDEPIELQQRELGPGIVISQAMLKLKEFLQIVGQRTMEERLHFGTGSVTPRRRRSATRTYTAAA